MALLKKITGKRLYKRYISLHIIKPILNIKFNALYNYIANPNKIIWISINDIYGWYRGYIFDSFTYPGIIKGGDWEKKIKKKKLTETANYRGLHQRYIEGMPWRKTVLFKDKYTHVLNKGRKVRGFSNLCDIEKYYELKYDKLFKNIKCNGLYLPNTTDSKINSLYIHIYKNGEFLWTSDGNHRLSICSILGIKKIPVRVWMRHKKWQEKREKILKTQRSTSGEKVIPEKKYSNHPDIFSELQFNE